MNTKQNIVPSDAPRRVVLQKGVLFRFGFQLLEGTNLCKVGEVVYLVAPAVDELRAVQQEYCRVNNIDEPFVPSDYGY